MLALAGCQQAAVSVKGPAADYQAPTAAAAAPANVKAICYNETDLSAFRVRMVQQSLVVGVLQCKATDGTRLYDKQWAEFIRKFDPELSENFREMKTITGRKRANYDVMITEVANRTGGRPALDPEFCARQGRAFDWALTPQVTSLKQVPSPYDFGPEMNIHACPP